MTKKQKKMLCRIIVTAVLVLAIRLFSIGGLPGTLLYLAAYLIIGYDILRKAGKGILRGQVFDENFLMAVATVCCFTRLASCSRATLWARAAGTSPL